MSTPQRRRPAGRYDDGRRSSRIGVIAAALVVGLVVSFGATKLYQRRTAGTVPFELRGYAVSSASAVKVSWEVSLARGARGECQLKARGRAGQQVGLAVVPVGPGTGKALQVEHVLTTTERASAVEVRACRSVPAP